jgi:arabinofuranosyltransferase
VSSKVLGRARDTVEPLVLGLAGLAFVALAHYHARHVCDDAFIVFRYADNWVRGLGPVWNSGEKVEGFSSPLWLGLLTLGRLFGLGLSGWATALGLLFAASTLVLVHRLALVLSHSRIAAACACAGAALIDPIHYWAPAGLETACFAFLITAAAWALLTGPSWRWAAIVALLGLARPEGPFLAIAMVALIALGHGRPRPARLLVALLPVASWLIFRRGYYGDWLPNTYYAKATGALRPRVEGGLLYATWALVVAALAGVAAWLSGLAERRVVSVLALIVASLAVVIGGGGDWMWHARMLAPMLPAVLALTVAAIARAPAHRRWVLLAAALVVWPTFAPKPSVLVAALAGRQLPASEFQEGELVQASLAAAKVLVERYPRDVLVAVNHAGALPFALPNPALDMTGLLDRHIAHATTGGLHRKFDPRYVLSRKPALVILNSAVRPGTDGTWYHPGYWVGETALVAQSGWADYRPTGAFWEWKWTGGVSRYIVVFERRPDGNTSAPALP